MRALIDLVRIMRARDRRRLALIAFGLAIAALLEVVGVASVIPFLTLVGDPSAATRVPYLVQAREALGLTDERSFLLVTGGAALLAILTTAVVNAGLTYAQLLFTHLAGYGFSRRLLFRYLDRERLVFAQANSAELAKNVLSETDRLVVGVLTPATVLASRATSALAVIAFLLAYAPQLALILGGGFGGLYVGIYLIMRARLARLGSRSVTDNEARFRIVQETFGALTELKLYGRAGAFAGRFDAPARAYAVATAASLLTGQMPRFVIEALAFGGVIVVVLFALAQGLDVAGILPLLGLFAFAGYRMLPAFQNIFTSISLMRFYRPVVQVIVDELADERRPGARTSERLPYAREIRLEGIGFDYGTGRPALAENDLTIPANTTIGLAGRTGSGKSTLAGLLLGVLTPSAGRITVDGRELDSNALPAWQNRIGYVPQDVFLVDGTVAENIALGLGAPDGAAVERQRIGIARALYHDPDVIVFDEATSALDDETQGAVMRALRALSGRRTLILIAHRLSTLEGADAVHVLEAGRLIASGPPEAILPGLGNAA